MEEDWRLLRGQESYLKGASLIYHKYIPSNSHNDHDHCVFCMTKFGYGDEDTHLGYSTLDSYIWICDQCYEDFKEKFQWKIF